jgi:uncharacterized membrane protein
MLPERIATHWGADGQPDDWSSRAFGAWLMPGIMLGVWLLLRLLPRIDPKGENYARFQGTFAAIIAMVVAFMGLVQVAIVGTALGWPISINRVIPLGVGGLFLGLGNLLPRVRPTWFVGIRTPWTLSSDRVWERTHRLGGMLFMISGVVIIAAGFGPQRLLIPAIAAAVVLSAVTPIVYSFVIWRKERKTE